jgi:hypothetical protein
LERLGPEDSAFTELLVRNFNRLFNSVLTSRSTEETFIEKKNEDGMTGQNFKKLRKNCPIHVISSMYGT